MKKALFLLLLLPFIGFSQSNLAIWNGTSSNNFAASTTAPNMTAGAWSAQGGLSYQNDQWDGGGGGFILTNWQFNGTPTPTVNTSKYLEFTAAPNSGYKISASQFKFYLNTTNQTPTKLRVKATINDGATWIDLTNANVANQTELSITQQQIALYTLSFPSGFEVIPGQTVKIRVYMYDFTDNWYTKVFLKTAYFSTSTTNAGPTLTGTVSAYGGNYATVADNASTFVTQPVFVNVLGNDTAGTTTATSINISTQATNGTAAQATVNGILGVNYTPNNSYAGGTDSFYYTVTNGNGTSAAAKVTVTVNPFVAPTANADTATVTENGSVIVSVLGNDAYGTSTTYSGITFTTQPAHGSVIVNGTGNSMTVTYTPNQWYFATGDSFAYKVTDANGKTSNAATVSVSITALASPTVSNYTKTTGQNIAVSTNVLAGATAGSGTITGVAIVGTATNGTATVDANNNVVFTPATGFTGTGVVTYKVSNSNQKSTNGTVTVNVEAITAATATADAYTIAKNTSTELSVMANDNIGNSALTGIVVVTAPTHGTATITNTNKITYVPATGYTGADSFSYKITNAYNTNATATVSLTVVEPSPTGALVGTFTVGTGGHFATITAAVNHLNQYGVTGNVVFSLINNAATKIYNIANGESFPIVVNSFTNPSNATVTFKPATGKNVVISAGNLSNTTWSPTPAVFKLNGADNIIFDGSNTANGTTRNLIIKNADQTMSTDRAILWIASNGSDGAKNITVKNTVISMVLKNADYAYATGIFSGNNSFTNNSLISDTATADNSGLTVTNNDFVNVKQGVYVNGGSSLTTNVNIKGNDLGAENNTETVVEPSRLNNVKDFTYTENLIYNLHRESAGASLVSSGLYVTGNSSNGSITKNNIHDLYKTLDEGHYFAGIVLNSTNTASNILVANNFILNVAGYAVNNYQGGGHGIIAVSGGGYKIYHNTVSLNTAQHGTGDLGYSAALYVIDATGLDVRNNIFANNQPAYGNRRSSAIAVKGYVSNINTIFSQLDYNDYYTSNTKFSFIGANSGDIGQIEWYANPDYVTDFSTWKSVTGKDAHSKNVNPTFASVSDLHVNAYSAANNGFADAGTNAINTTVPKDIDGQVRKTDTPNMGADEFGAVAMPTPGSNAGIYCDSSTTWNGTAWSNGTPTASTDVIFNGNYTQTGGTFNACSVYVLAGKSVNFTTNSTANVVHSVNIADTGALTFESGSHLVQVENDQNSGIATVKRKGGLLKRLDYTLWSAPVVDPREGVTGTSTNYQSLQEFSPATISNRFNYYNTATDLYVAYAAPAATKFTKGQSVLIRMPDVIPGNADYNNGVSRVQFDGIFEGTPTTGTQRIALNYVNGKGYNAVGNPYPSPINIAAFIQENAVNSGVISGTIWLWRKTNNSALSSYATCTLEGYINNVAMNPDGTGNNEGNTALQNPFDLTGGIAGGGLLNTGQGFIVKALAPNKDLIFKNNMRDGSVHTNSFFKTNNNGEGTTDANQDGRFWINVKGSETFSQALVSYHDYTTDGYDNGYDGTVIISGNLNLYSTLAVDAETARLAIQAKSMFTDNDIVPLGFVASAAGTYTFEIDRTEGVFSQGQQIFVKDNMLGVTHNLSDGSFDFTTDAGTFNTRFEVVYQPQGQLGTDLPVADAKDVIVYRDGKQIKVTSSEVISSVTVFDMLGRTLYTNNNIDATEFTTSELNTAQQVVIVNITLDNQQVISKKIMMN